MTKGKCSNLYFWRDQSGNEIDVLIAEGLELIPEGIKSGQMITRDYFKGLKFWEKLIGKSRGMILKNKRRGIHTMPTKENIIAVSREQIDEAIDVLVSAFFDYPVFRFILPETIDRRSAKLVAVIRFYVLSRLLRGWPVYALEADGEFQAVILANPPQHVRMPPELEAEERRLGEVLGADAEERRRFYESASDAGEPEAPHFFIGMIGVRTEARGRGYAKRLIEMIQAFSEADPVSQGIALATENVSNLSLYQHLGYTIITEAKVGPIHTWAMWRPDGKES